MGKMEEVAVTKCEECEEHSTIEDYLGMTTEEYLRQLYKEENIPKELRIKREDWQQQLEEIAWSVLECARNEKEYSVEASWSGRHPNLCCGEWSLVVNGIDVSDKIPRKLSESPMNTYGEYRRAIDDWETGDVVYFTYEDGLQEEAWIRKNDYWLNKITDKAEIKSDIFKEIQFNDFRGGSCGGCFS